MLSIGAVELQMMNVSLCLVSMWVRILEDDLQSSSLL